MQRGGEKLKKTFKEKLNKWLVISGSFQVKLNLKGGKK